MHLVVSMLVACGSAGPRVNVPVDTETHAPECHGAWCFMNGGVALRDVAIIDNEAWAVGEWGTVMHHDGTRWTRELVGDVTLNRVWPRAKDDVWVIGDQGFVAHRDASGWKRIASNTTVELLDIEGLGPDDVWIAGANSVVVHWDGRSTRWWTLAETGPALTAILPRSKDVVWFGTAGGVFAWDVKTSSITQLTDDPVAVADLWSSPETSEVLAVDENGGITSWNGHHWTSPSPRTHVNPGARFVASGSELWVTGVARLVQRKREQWVPTLEVDDEAALSSTRSSTHALAVGVGGRIARWSGRGWALERGSRLTSTVSSIWSDERETVFVAGNKLGRWRAGTVEEIVSDASAIYGIAGGSSSDLYVATSLGVSRFDGKTLTWMTTSPQHEVEAISMGDPVWAVGEKSILKLVGNEWVGVEHPDVDTITDVWSASPSFAMALGSTDGRRIDADSVILRWDGHAWTIARTPGVPAWGLAGFDATHAWLCTRTGLLAWDGNTWEPARGWPAKMMPVEVSVVTADDVWVVTEPQSDPGVVVERSISPRSSIAHWDGKTWTSESIGIEITAIHARRDSVWIGGRGGAVLRRARP